MSSNARECPHCGETDFFEPEMGWFSEPCRYEDSPRHALGCEGKGFLCRTEIMESYGIISLRDLRDMGVRDLSKYVCIREELYLSCDNAALREKIARAAAHNGLYLKTYGRSQSELFLGKVRCPRCKGTGKVTVRKPTGNYIDIRKRI